MQIGNHCSDLSCVLPSLSYCSSAFNVGTFQPPYWLIAPAFFLNVVMAARSVRFAPGLATAATAAGGGGGTATSLRNSDGDQEEVLSPRRGEGGAAGGGDEGDSSGDEDDRKMPAKVIAASTTAEPSTASTTPGGSTFSTPAAGASAAAQVSRHPELICPNCGSQEIEQPHDASGASICMVCGVVVEENAIVSAVEYV